MSEKIGRKRRKALTVQDKLDKIEIKQIQTITNEEIATKYGCDPSCISKILKNKEKYLKEADTRSTKKCRIQNGMFEIIDNAVYEWYKNARSHKLFLSQAILKQKAKEFFQLFEAKGHKFKKVFEASNGWLNRFQERFNLCSKKTCGESGSVNENDVQSGRDDLKDVIQNYPPNNIYNADETGLFYRLGPDRNIVHRDEEVKGYKKDKARTTCMLGTNASGTVLLLVDNCPAHTDVDDFGLKKIRVKFLPPNTTSVLQPLDAGIINSFKVKYRTQLIKDFIKTFDQNKKIEQINLDKAFDFISIAWSQVKAGFKHYYIVELVSAKYDSNKPLEGVNDTSDDDDDGIEIPKIDHDCGGIHFKNFINYYRRFDCATADEISFIKGNKKDFKKMNPETVEQEKIKNEQDNDFETKIESQPQDEAKSSLPEDKRRELIEVQEQELKKLLRIVADAKSPENDLDEKDELIFLRVYQSQLKFQLTQKDDLIKNLTEQLNNKKTVQFSENESVSRKDEEREESDKNDNEESDEEETSEVSEEENDDYQLNQSKIKPNRDFYKLTYITDQSMLLDNNNFDSTLTPQQNLDILFQNKD
ncbi:unnamed protein product [Brachionus calyciflorus]|uniref:HTH CENPB-type domain-containing protein n=1 Tax=Brachionus calyciflorus TaxID=104777 RepID=A0A814J7N5_9BILA|nr:unnamed protein product [Brachionus calyciflorus]